MDYNMEVISSAAKQIAEMFKSILMSQQQSRPGVYTIAQIENLHAGSIATDRIAGVGQFLSAMQTTPESEIACTCGGTLRYQRMREATITSVFGKTSYLRAYYAGCCCQKGKSPLTSSLD